MRYCQYPRGRTEDFPSDQNAPFIELCKLGFTEPIAAHFRPPLHRSSSADIDVGDPLQLKHGMSNATFYSWRSKYGGMDASSMKRLKELEEENARLKKMMPRRS